MGAVDLKNMSDEEFELLIALKEAEERGEVYVPPPQPSQFTNQDIALQDIRETPSRHTGILATAGEQALQGATFGLADEAEAAIGAIYAKLLGGSNTSGIPIEDLYEQALLMKRKDIAAQQEEHPIVSLAAQLGGIILTGGATATTAPGRAIMSSLGRAPGRTLGGRMAKTGVLGGAVEGTTGFGTGTGGLEERLSSAGEQAQTGAIFGTALPLAGTVLRASKGLPIVKRFFKSPPTTDIAAYADYVADATNTVKQRADAYKALVSSKFDEARAAGEQATINRREVLDPIQDRIQERLKDEALYLDQAGMEPARKIIERFDELKKQPGVIFNQLESIRGDISKNIRRTGDPAVKEALRNMQGAYDDVIKPLGEAAIIRGDRSAVDKWANARRLRYHQEKIFGANRAAKETALFSDILGKHNLSNREIANVIFGAGDVGTKAVGEQIARRMLKAAGKQRDSVRVNLRNGLILRTIDSARNEVDGLIDPVKLKSNVNRLLKKNAAFTSEIASKMEIDALKRFANSIDKGLTQGAGRAFSKIFEHPLGAIVGGEGISKAVITPLQQRGYRRNMQDYLNELLSGETIKALDGDKIFYGTLIKTSADRTEAEIESNGGRE